MPNNERSEIIDALISSCQELLNAMRSYEMDADTDPPHKHLDMMRRAKALIQSVEITKLTQ